MCLWDRTPRFSKDPPDPFRTPSIPFFRPSREQEVSGGSGFLETIPYGSGSLLEKIQTERENPMKEMALLLGILAAWVLLQSVVLPYLGVST